MSGLAHRSGRTAGFEGGPLRSLIVAVRPCSSARRSGVRTGRLVNEHGHLVTHESDVALGRSDDGEARAVADAGDEQKRVFHFDDDFVNADFHRTDQLRRRQGQSARDATGGKTVCCILVQPPERAIGKPSDETTTASLTPGTRSAKFAMSQLTLLAALLMVMTTRPRGWAVSAGALGEDSDRYRERAANMLG